MANGGEGTHPAPGITCKWLNKKEILAPFRKYKRPKRPVLGPLKRSQQNRIALVRWAWPETSLRSSLPPLLWQNCSKENAKARAFLRNDEDEGRGLREMRSRLNAVNLGVLLCPGLPDSRPCGKKSPRRGAARVGHPEVYRANFGDRTLGDSPQVRSRTHGITPRMEPFPVVNRT
jgi:hypothetical protein